MSKQESAKNKTRTSFEVQSTSKSELALAFHSATFYKPNSPFTRMEDGSASLTCLVNYCESIEEYIGRKSNAPDPKKHGNNNSKSFQKKISQKFCVNLLLKVTHCLQQMSENEVDHGQVYPSCVYLSSDKKLIAIGDECVNPRPKSLKFLAKLFLFVLSEGRITDHIPCRQKMNLNELKSCLRNKEDVNPSNFLSVLLDLMKRENQNNIHFDTLGGFLHCQEPSLALDLIIKLCSKDCDYNANLSHPFFWPPYKKCQFLCAVFCKVKNEKKSGYDEKADEKLQNDYQIIGKEVLPKGGWIKKLEISSDDVKEINKQNIIVNAQTVETKAKNYKSDSVFDFLRFFRNCYSHIWEGANKHAFGGDSVGYWNFFASRYPRFLHYVYSKTWEDLRKGNVEFHCFEECAPEPRYLSG